MLCSSARAGSGVAGGTGKLADDGVGAEVATLSGAE